MKRFPGAVKSKRDSCRFFRDGPKVKKICEDFKKTMRFFEQNLSGKLIFSIDFTKYFVDFCLISETIYSVQDNTSLLQQFFRFRDRSGVPTLQTLQCSQALVGYHLPRIFPKKEMYFTLPCTNNE